MIMIPPKEIMQYLTTDENGNWIASDDMPDELQETFAQFLKRCEEAERYKKSFFK